MGKAKFHPGLRISSQYQANEPSWADKRIPHGELLKRIKEALCIYATNSFKVLNLLYPRVLCVFLLFF